MTDLSSRISQAINRILRATEGLSKEKLSSSETADESSTPEAKPTQPASLSLSPNVLNRLAAEGSGARVKTLSSGDPNGGALPVSTPGHGTPGHGRDKQAEGPKNKAGQHPQAHHAHGQGAHRNDQVSNAPLTNTEKLELLTILQHLDPTYTMAEINYLIDGINSGEITDVSFRSLRRVVEAAREYGIDFVVASLKDEDGAVSLPPTQQPSAPSPQSPTTETPEKPPANSTGLGQLPGHTTDTPPSNNNADDDTGTQTTTEETTVTGRTPGKETDNGNDASASDTNNAPPQSPSTDEEETSPTSSPADEVDKAQEDIDDVTDEMSDLEATGEEIGQVQEDLTDVQEELSDVQDELEEVQEVIADIRQIVSVIRSRINDFRLSRTLQSDTLPHLRLSKNSLLTNAFKEKTQESERFDTEQLKERRTQQKMMSEQQAFEQELAQQQWRSQAASQSDFPSDHHINPEAEAPDVS